MGKDWNWSTSIWKFIIHWKIVQPRQVTKLRQTSTSWASTKYCSLWLLYLTAWFSLCSPCAVSRMDANSCITCVSEMTSIAEQCSSLRESHDQSRGTKSYVIRIDQRKQNLLCIKSWHFYRLRLRWRANDSWRRRKRADKNTKGTCASWIPGR